MRKETDADQIDFNKKILHMSWHPFEDSIAIAATNNVSLPRPAADEYLLTIFQALRFLCVVEWSDGERTPRPVMLSTIVDEQDFCHRYCCREVPSYLLLVYPTDSVRRFLSTKGWHGQGLAWG